MVVEVVGSEVIVQPYDVLVHGIGSRYPVEVCRQEHIDEQQQEVLPIVEANAVVDPGAVVVHVEYAFLTG